MTKLPAEIFKAYDIRGIVDKSLTADVVRQIGHTLARWPSNRARRPSPSAATAACPAPNWPAR